jgi:hypothetical protein
MFAGAAVLVCGSIALIVLALAPTGPRRQRLVGLAFLATGVGLGSAWVGYGLELLAPGRSGPGGLVAIFLTLIGLVAILVSLRTWRQLG